MAEITPTDAYEAMDALTKDYAGADGPVEVINDIINGYFDMQLQLTLQKEMKTD